MILGTVEVGRVIRFGVVLAGEYVTWYSIVADPQYTLGVAVNEKLCAESVITFCLYPLIEDKSMLMLQTVDLYAARREVT